jgi:hypothetical protein
MERVENLEVSRSDATSRDTEQYTVSVTEAAELFTAAGLPRTERAIQRFCKRGDLLCAFVDTPFGSKYLIKRSSLDRLIEQKLQTQTFSAEQDGRDLSRPDATVRDVSRQEPEPAHPNAAARDAEISNSDKVVFENESRDRGERQGATVVPELESKVKKLEEENINLKVDNRGKEAFITMLVNERKEMATAMQDLSYKLGVAETRVLQLEAPKEPRHSSDTSDDMPRHVATEPHEPMVIIAQPSEQQIEPAANPEPQPEPERRSFLGRLFG